MDELDAACAVIDPFDPHRQFYAPREDLQHKFLREDDRLGQREPGPVTARIANDAFEVGKPALEFDAAAEIGLAALVLASIDHWPLPLRLNERLTMSRWADLARKSQPVANSIVNLNEQDQPVPGPDPGPGNGVQGLQSDPGGAASLLLGFGLLLGIRRRHDIEPRFLVVVQRGIEGLERRLDRLDRSRHGVETGDNRVETIGERLRHRRWTGR